MIEVDAIKRSLNIVEVVRRYSEHVKQVRGAQWMARCCFHEDRTASMSVDQDKGLFHCFGCGKGGDAITLIADMEGMTFQDAAEQAGQWAGIVPARATVARAGVPRSKTGETPTREPKRDPEPSERKIVATYDYVDYSGKLIYQVVRFDPKGFSQRRPNAGGGWEWGLGDVPRLLYRLPELIAAEEVWLVEGEKDVHTLEAAGAVATTPSGGVVQKWLESFTEALEGRTVYIIPDNDAPGRKRARELAHVLAGKAREVIPVEVPEPHKDVTEFFEHGGTLTALLGFAAQWKRLQRLEQLKNAGLLSLDETLDLTGRGFRELIRPPAGIYTGFLDLDQLTHGLHRGELALLAARPSVGKTALAMNIASTIALQGKPVAFFSVEMPREALWRRVLASVGRVPAERIRKADFDEEQIERLEAASERLRAAPLRIDDSARQITEIRARLERMMRWADVHLVVIDYLQLLRGPERARSKYEEIAEISTALKQMAGELRLPLLVLCQLSREPERRRGDRRPQLSDLRDSGQLEQDADLVMLLYREELHKPDREDVKGIAELIVAKQRNGPIGTVKLVYVDRLVQFANIAKQYDMEEEEK